MQAEDLHLLYVTAAISAAFSWRDDKPCETCHGKMFVKRKGWYCGCGAGIKHMRDCGRPAPHDKCPDCISGRVEGDRRVILARQVGWGFKIAPPVLGLFPWTFSELRDETDGVPMFVATPAQEAERGEPS
jgi:hypothetical protein